MGQRSIGFVENRYTLGCFEAGVEALTHVDQREIHEALDRSELYTPDGLMPADADTLNASMRDSFLPLNFEEVLPHFDAFSDDNTPLDDDPAVVAGRLATLQRSLEEDNHEGLIISYPCERPGNPQKFGHFVAAIEGQEAGAALTVMDPSELRHPQTNERIGGVFQKSEEEVLQMLTPFKHRIPVFAFLVRHKSLRPAPVLAEAEAVVEIPLEAETPTEPVLAYA